MGFVPRQNIVLYDGVFFSQCFPQIINSLFPLFFQQTSATSGIAGHYPPNVMDHCQNQFGEHLGCSIECDANQHKFTVVIWPSSWLLYYYIDVDAGISHHCVPKKPTLSISYQDETKKTLSLSYFFPPC